jgi:hypothetical protein
MIVLAIDYMAVVDISFHSPKHIPVNARCSKASTNLRFFLTSSIAIRPRNIVITGDIGGPNPV